ncbi:MAG: FAD-binding and (Fe-S)-binding domain-containing protein [Thermodesulfobacteriota bacterium]
MLQETRKELLDVFGERVAFHETERILYSGDISVVPDFVRRQINTCPDAVVQPNCGGDLTALVNVALKYGIPLIPRGAGTAGYGGAVPVHGGIVVDFNRLNRVIEFDKNRKTVAVESGAVWNELQAELGRHGLALRLYPSSAVSSTVAGWVGNGGGVGIGSFEYGFLKDNVIEAEIITPRGVRRLAHDEIDLIFGMAGTTGLISRVTLMARDLEEDIPALGVFATLEDLLKVFEEIGKEEIPLWEVSYRDPLHVQRCREAIERQAGRFPIHHEAKEMRLPQDKFIATFACPQSRESKVRDKLLKVVHSHHGEAIEGDLARAEWDERFYPLRLKALGPSLIPSEVIIPTEKLPLFMKHLSGKTASHAFNGTLINHGGQITVLTYSLDDERRRGFPLAYSKSFVSIEAAKKLGGRPYTIGMYLVDDAESVLGDGSLLRIHRFKQAIDPDVLMNPGKVFPRSLNKKAPLRLGLMLKLARSQAGAITAADRFFGGNPPGETSYSETQAGRLAFGGGAIWDAFACAGCGFCRRQCPQFGAIGWESASPRGKFHFLHEYLKGNVKLDERMADMFFTCTTCQQCNQICQVKSNVEEDWTLVARPLLLKNGGQPATMFQRRAHHILLSHNPNGAPQEERTAWMTSDLRYKEEGEMGYFVGCNASYAYNLRNLPINAFRVLNRAGIEPVYLGSEEWCCGGGTVNIGYFEELLEIVGRNINELNRRGIKTLVTSCSGCWTNLAHYYPILAQKLNLKYQIDVRHTVQVVSELIESGRIQCKSPVSLKVTYHDPCHIGRGGGIYEPPRRILASIPGLELMEMPRNRERGACCGRHIVRYPRLGSIINNARTMEAAHTGAPVLVTCCPTCESNFRVGITANKVKMEVLDIIDLVAETMGLPRLAVSKIGKLLYKQDKERKNGSLSH